MLDGNLSLSWMKLNCEKVPFTNTRMNTFTIMFLRQKYVRSVHGCPKYERVHEQSFIECIQAQHWLPKESWTTWTGWWLPTAAKGGPYTCHWWYFLTYWKSLCITPFSSGWHWSQRGTEVSSRGDLLSRNWERYWWDLESREDNMFQEPQPLQPSWGGFRRRMLPPHPPDP